jgi:hypothetical protein
MPRFHTPTATADQLIQRARKLFEHTPLCTFLATFELRITEVAGTTDSTNRQGMESLLRLVDFYERLFLNGFGNRFDVDAWMSSDICDRWSNSSVNLPRQIIPIYGSQWAYSLLPAPLSKERPVCIYAVCFPGRSEISDLDLLEYPWLCHELGHHLLSRSGSNFAQNFKHHLDQFVKTAIRKATADSPSLRTKSLDRIQKLQKLWTPRSNTQDWAHELAADTIALWTCGPAFVAAMQHALATERIQPYEIVESHPPYELRLRMLLNLAENLDWGKYCSALKTTINHWREGHPQFDMNEYSALADVSLAEECCSQIVKACRVWDLPLCTPEYLHRVQQKLEAGENLESAAEIILAAWSVYQKAPSASPAWEANFTAQLIKELNGDA